jgi:hypothetical protein
LSYLPHTGLVHGPMVPTLGLSAAY